MIGPMQLSGQAPANEASDEMKKVRGFLAAAPKILFPLHGSLLEPKQSRKLNPPPGALLDGISMYRERVWPPNPCKIIPKTGGK